MSFDTFWNALHGWLSLHGWRIVLIIAVASFIRRFGTIFIGRLIGRSVEHSERFENQRDRLLRIDTLKSLVASVLKVATWIIVVLLVLSDLNVLKVLAPLLAGAGILGLLVGFGIQAFVKDLISGVFVIAENQYRVGDVISATTTVGGTVDGRVTRITLRTTVLRDNEGAIHFIPNGNIARAANQTLDYAKINIEVSLPIKADVEEAERKINELGVIFARDDAWSNLVVQAPYFHGVQAFTSDNLTIEVRAKTVPAEQWSVSSELQKRLIQMVSDNNYFIESHKKNRPVKKLA